MSESKKSKSSTTSKQSSTQDPKPELSKKRKHSNINELSSSNITSINSHSSLSSAESTLSSSSLINIDCSNLQYLSLPLDDNHNEVLRIFIKPIPTLPITTALSSSSSSSSSSTGNEGTDLLILSSSQSHQDTNNLADTELEAAFAHVGDIEILTRGSIGDDESINVPYVIIRLATSKARRKILNMTSIFPTHDQDGRLFGLRGWLAAHEASKVDARKLQAHADNIVNKYDIKQEENERKQAELTARMEADGFTLVNHKLSKIDHNDTTNNGEEEGSAIKRKKNRGSLISKDFYRFQQTQDKLQRLTTLKEQFEEDKERIRLIKEKRTFKPY